MGGKRKTPEQFIEEVKNLVGDEYKVLGEYKNATTKLEMGHAVCGETYNVRPTNFLNGTRCPNCSTKKKIEKTTEEFKKEVEDVTGGEFEVKGEYKGAWTEVAMYHKVCEKDFEAKPILFLRNRYRCPYCRDNTSLTTAEFKERVSELVGDEYTVLGEYVNNKTKLKVRHEACKNEYMVTPTNFFMGSRCPECKTYSKGLDDFKKEVFDLVGDEYRVLGEYRGVTTKILMIHEKCHKEYSVTPASFVRGARCPVCANKKRGKRLTTSEFKERLYGLVGDEYTVLGDYVNNRTKLKVRHEVCKEEYMVSPINFFNGSRCKGCSDLKKER